MKKDFFKPEDFCDIDFAAMDYAADVANEKLNKLIESWPVVFNTTNNAGITSWIHYKPIGYHSQARLAFIEEIKKEECKHRLHDVSFIVSMDAAGNVRTRCADCNTYLIAEWREVGK